VSTPSVSPFAASPLATVAEPTIKVTDEARTKLIELRDEEPEGNRLGVRIEILADTPPEFTYDLTFAVLTKADITDQVDNHDGLRTIIPLKDVENLRGATLDFEAGGLVLRNPNRPKPLSLGTLTITGSLADEIRGIIEAEINPALDAHGGFVTFVGHDDDNAIYLTMGGGCHGCSMSRLTMVQGVSSMIREKIPSVSKVVDVTDHAVGENPYYH
jgi:Fe/S biogenesis protein NfuA